jgi:DNA-binding IclR family transcriptional regulator
VRFIARYIVSVEKLEILLLFHDAPDRGWNAGEVFGAIQSHPESVGRWLKELYAEGFLQQEKDGYRYAPPGPLAEGAAALKTAYQERPARVIEAIFSKPTEQLRKFADAFRLRKDKDP